MKSAVTFLLMGGCLLIVVVLCLATISQLTRSDEPQDFAFLASALFVDLPAEGNPPLKLTPPEEVVMLRKRITSLDRISRRSKTLAPIAEKMLLNMNRAEALQQKSPDFSNFLFGVAEAALGVYSGQRDKVGTGGQTALVEAKSGVDYLKEQAAVIDEQRILAVEMLDFVPKFSGAATNTPAFLHKFEKHQAGIFDVHSALRMVNNSGIDLHNCVAAVRLSNAQGDSSLSLFFTQKWKSAATNTAAFAIFDSSKNRTTVFGVNRVEVQIWTSEFSVAPTVLTEQGQASWGVGKQR